MHQRLAVVLPDDPGGFLAAICHTPHSQILPLGRHDTYQVAFFKIAFHMRDPYRQDTHGTVAATALAFR